MGEGFNPQEIIDHSYKFVPKPRSDQGEIGKSKARFRVVACGRRWGKTTLGLRLALNRVVYRAQRVWWVAPTYGLAFYPWLILKQALEGHWENKQETARYIGLPNGGSIMVKTADNPDHLRGVGLDFVVIDEAAFIDRYVWEAVLLPALADRNGRALIISTPKGRNWFHDGFVRGQDKLIRNWKSWQAPTSENPKIKKSYLNEVRALLPDYVYEQEYEAKFLTDGGEVFRGVRDVATADENQEPDPKHSYVMGVDFGRYTDFTVAVVIDMDTMEVVAIDRFNQVRWNLQRERIKVLAEHWDVDTILAEANAMGEPNIEALQGEGLPVEGFQTTAQSKTALIESLVVAIEDGSLKILPDPVLINELESYSYTLLSSGRYQYSAPSGRHDDTVIALALAWKVASIPPFALGIAG